MYGNYKIYYYCNNGLYLHYIFYTIQGTKMEMEVLVAQSCLTLCDPIDCSPPAHITNPLVHVISQARILVWVAITVSRRSS